jgi:Tfx family DNA-binding protein
MDRGSLTDSQYRVLQLRGRGLTQKETAAQLGITRASVSMIEHRARRKVALARNTIEAYQATLSEYSVLIPRGTMFYEIPVMVLKAGDRRGIHLQSNLVEIIRMVREMRPPCLEDGRTTRGIHFFFNQVGRLRMGPPRR